MSSEVEVAPAVRSVSAGRALHWLALGLRDLLGCPALSLAHGVVFAAFGALLAWFARDRFWLLAGAFSGFLVVAPVLATGLYSISRSLQRTGRATLSDVTRTWLRFRTADGPLDTRMLRFGLLLALAGTGWVLTSAALITVFAPQPIERPMDFLRHVVLAPDNLLFESWFLLGAVLAAPVFASSVVALPMLLDRPSVSVLQAVLTSWRTVLANPAAMALWAALILLLTLVGLATALLGLIVTLPLLGHASWHAYRDLVAPGPRDTLPEPGLGAPP